ncbi:MAG: polyribonucleotide nucleotidyltransferase [Candidatus Kaiserbacteria bacterium]|nr:polyribonucleotide nucleotidyltransferase [Candidatus Kaiserbacteria bacterium]
MQEKKTYTVDIDGTTITATITDLADQADGAVLVEAGDTVVFVTAMMSDHEATQDYFPLSVDFEERFYSVGAILGSRFVRREGRPSQEAVLNARIIDRTIRPLFPKGLRREVQIIATVLSFGTYNPDTLALLGTSLALGISRIPWNGPVGGVRLSGSGNDWTLFTPFDRAKRMDSHILLCGTGDVITMIEAEGVGISEESVVTVGESALSHIKTLQTFQEEIIREIGKEKMAVEPPKLSDEAERIFESSIRPNLHNALFSPDQKMSSVRESWVKKFTESDCSDDLSVALEHFENVADTIIHDEAIDNGRRADGRGVDEVRPLYAQAGGVSSRLHGSGIFYRGGTHVFTALTLGSPGDALMLNTVEDPDRDERFMHHYNFPPYSSGETGRVGSPKRREIGHGALAEKALRGVLPSQDEFPYTMRLVSECFASNGSTSMGSVCASTLALMDGGVPIKEPVAGIAIGLMQRGDKSVVLTDIQGPEDHHGDMDFKVAGTRSGITAIQMDVKINGITIPILTEALDRAKSARHAILETITNEIAVPRDSLSQHAPHLATLSINPDMIGMIIGTGGKTINTIRTDSGVDSIDVEDDGTVTIAGSQEAVSVAKQRIQEITSPVEVGDTFDGAVKTVRDFGAFVELTPTKDGMVHVSELSPTHIDTVESVLSVGDVVPVVVKEVRPDGRIALSVKDRDPTFFDNVVPKESNKHAAPTNHTKKRSSRRGRRGNR